MGFKLTSNNKELSIGYVPVLLTYYVSFQATTDFAILVANVYGDLNTLSTDAAMEFELTLDNGSVLKFAGTIYNIKYAAGNVIKFYLVSKYYKKLMSTLPLFGSGVGIDILKSFYRKAGITKIEAADATGSFDNLLLTFDKYFYFFLPLKCY